jgi:hypothetical protein
MPIAIPLTSKAGIVAVAVIDDIDAHLAEYRWCLSDGYAVRRKRLPDGSSRNVKLHREVLGLDPGDPRPVDHRNRDRLDCRRQNLRLTTPRANARNRGLRADNTTGLKGVSPSPDRPGWFHAQIGWSEHGARRKQALGDWPTRELAGYAYDLRAQEIDPATATNQSMGLLPAIPPGTRDEILARRQADPPAVRQSASGPRSLRRNPRSQLFGIAWIARRQRWRVHFMYAGKRCSGGYFADRIDAGYRADELIRAIDPDAMTNERMGWLPPRVPGPDAADPDQD